MILNNHDNIKNIIMASSEIRTKQNMSIAASSAIRVLKNENPSKIEDIKTCSGIG